MRRSNIALKCLNCGKNRAQKIKVYGYMFCRQCLIKQRLYDAHATIELTTDQIKEDRKEYSGDILQRYEGSTPNLNYIKKYGKKGYTQEELKRAKPDHNTYYRDTFEKL